MGLESYTERLVVCIIENKVPRKDVDLGSDVIKWCFQILFLAVRQRKTRDKAAESA